MVIVERFSRPGIMVLGIVAALILGLKLLKPVPDPGRRARGGTGRAGIARGTRHRAADLPETAPSPSIQLRSRIQSESAITRTPPRR